MKQINRRESLRIDIKLKCHVKSPAIWMRGPMHTENISRNGLLLAWVGGNGPLPLPAIGQIVTVEIELPANHSFGPKCIHCQGTVARVSNAPGDPPMVALRINYMDFRELHDTVRRSMNALEPVSTAWMA